eukprot:CAMPEP_0119358282 /NCGR_PEP_ID=MMETSP1334-20130426/6516_1 /TAXON_ID=127549 /ORGANISM="Calcidiscus leptoporus, Strain RCC1130" /LENGTH=279 /DNA_ID=CAMNT_0007372737 /DNA_START=242 /DNA_END=1077 /DNA_ORIENTATION=+
MLKCSGTHRSCDLRDSSSDSSDRLAVRAACTLLTLFTVSAALAAPRGALVALSRGRSEGVVALHGRARHTTVELVVHARERLHVARRLGVSVRIHLLGSGRHRLFGFAARGIRDPGAAQFRHVARSALVVKRAPEARVLEIRRHCARELVVGVRPFDRALGLGGCRDHRDVGVDRCVVVHLPTDTERVAVIRLADDAMGQTAAARAAKLALEAGAIQWAHRHVEAPRRGALDVVINGMAGDVHLPATRAHIDGGLLDSAQDPVVRVLLPHSTPTCQGGA